MTRVTRLTDSLKVTSVAVADRGGGEVAGAHATQQGGGRGGDGYALAIFGKPPRESNCDCERTADPTLLQTLFMRNDPDLLQRIELAKDSSTWIDELRGDAPRPKGALRSVDHEPAAMVRL